MVNYFINRDFKYYGMDVPTLSTFLRPILTVTTVWNTGKTSEIYPIETNTRIEKFSEKNFDAAGWTDFRIFRMGARVPILLQNPFYFSITYFAQIILQKYS